MLHGLPQGLGELELGQRRDRAEQLVRTHPGPPRPPSAAPSGCRVQAGDVREQHVPQRGRKRRLPARGGREQLLREERIALGASEDRCRRAPPDGAVALPATPAPRLRRGRAARAPARPPRGRRSAGDASRWSGSPGRTSSRAVGADEQDARLGHAVGEKGEQVEGRGVGPVEILQRHDDRILARPAARARGRPPGTAAAGSRSGRAPAGCGPCRVREIRDRAAAARAAVPRARPAPANRRTAPRACTIGQIGQARPPRAGCSVPRGRPPRGRAPAGRARRPATTSRSRRVRRSAPCPRRLRSQRRVPSRAARARRHGPTKPTRAPAARMPGPRRPGRAASVRRRCAGSRLGILVQDPR